VIRGYNWDIRPELPSDLDGRGFYAEMSWENDSERLPQSPRPKRHAKTLVVPWEFVGAVRDVLDYLWCDEEHNYRETEAHSEGGHIFESLRRIKAWLDQHFADEACDEK
jgi:hypothetical protein